MNLHLIRPLAPAHAASLIAAQVAAGLPVTVVLVDGASPVDVVAAHVAVGEGVPQAEAVTWERVLELTFAADNVAVW
ncbi:MAG: hypothetical protein OEW11_00680 [Nitrospirota bacterium]|nr:hypothetical protein [Nitrospirota bacterium]